MESIEIRPGSPQDREAMLAMYRTFEPLGAAQGLPPVNETGRSQWIDRLLEEASHWVGIDRDGKLLGHTVLVESGASEAEIAFFVHQSYRCRRLGTRLVATALATARERGLRRVWASVCADNLPALRLLQARGFSRSELSFPTVELELLLQQPEPAALVPSAE